MNAKLALKGRALTGALLGLMTTLGARECDLVGVPGPPDPLWEPMPPSCDGINGWPGGNEPVVPCGDAWSELPRFDPPGPFSPGGNGLFLRSFNAVVDEVGVP